MAEGLKAMNVATRKDLSKVEKRLAEMEAELESLKARGAKPAAKPARKASGRKR